MGCGASSAEVHMIDHQPSGVMPEATRNFDELLAALHRQRLFDAPEEPAVRHGFGVSTPAEAWKAHKPLVVVQMGSASTIFAEEDVLGVDLENCFLMFSSFLWLSPLGP